MAAVLGGIPKRAVLASIAVLGLLSALALLEGADARPRTPEDPAERLVLRLHDLPLGYYPLDFSEGAELELICESINPFKSTRALDRFVRRFSPQGCMGLYLRAYRVPGAAPSSPVVGTGALDAGSLNAAEAGFAVAHDMLDALVENERLEEAPPAATVGDATRLFHWKRVPRLFRNGHHLGSFLVWRSGQVLAAVFASAGSLEVSDAIAGELAQRQQAHIENPTPYTDAERDHLEIALDNPALVVPVYWLGRRFTPKEGLPALQLVDVGSALTSPRRPRVNLFYGSRFRHGQAEWVNVNLWSIGQWKSLARNDRVPPGALNCMRTVHKVRLPAGQALIFRGVQSPRPRCDDRRARVYVARAYIGRVVVTVKTMGICDVCYGAGTGPYNSLAGMKAVVHGLTLRPQRTS